MIYTVGEARKRFSELVRKAAYTGEAITIGTRGKPEVALISCGELERLREIEDERDGRLLEEAVRTSRRAGRVSDLLAAWNSHHKQDTAQRASAKRKAG